jgi:hypothetical protein
MRCEECGTESGEQARGWRALIAGTLELLREGLRLD